MNSRDDTGGRRRWTAHYQIECTAPPDPGVRFQCGRTGSGNGALVNASLAGMAVKLGMHWKMLRELSRMVNTEILEAQDLVNSVSR